MVAPEMFFFCKFFGIKRIFILQKLKPSVFFDILFVLKLNSKKSFLIAEQNAVLIDFPGFFFTKY